MKASDFRAGKQCEKVGRLLHRHRRGQPAGWGYPVLLALLPALAAAVALAKNRRATTPVWRSAPWELLSGS